VKSLADAQVRKELLERVRTLAPDAKARWGKMNAHQMLCHLSDSFLGITGQRPVSSASGFLQRTVVKFFALYVPVEWPKGIQTRPEVDQMLGGTLPVEFERDRSELLRLIEWFASPSARKTEHPIFGAMSEAQWLRWAYLHVDHHLRQFGA
jgi:hypothetical protein